MASDKKKLEIILRDKHGAVSETAETVGQDKMTTVSNLLNKSFPEAQDTPAGLTLLGYSINDTIVNFDRIRENRKLIKGMSYREIVNLSINQTLARTILTSVTVALVLIMQLCFGGAAIRDFVFVMLIGVVVGTISTIFVSVIIIAYWHKNDKGIPEDSAKPEPKKA